MSNRKLLVEIERTLKKVNEGIQEFDVLLDKLNTASVSNQRDRWESEMKKEIKKLQRFRDQIKFWQTLNEIKDKEPLAESRKNIENLMEKFKGLEKDLKDKSYYYRDSSSSQPHFWKDFDEAKEKQKLEQLSWISDSIKALKASISDFELELENYTSTSLKKHNKKTDSSKSASFRQGLLENALARHSYHLKKLELLSSTLEAQYENSEDDDDFSGHQQEALASIKDFISEYLEHGTDEDYIEDESIYDDFDFEIKEKIIQKDPLFEPHEAAFPSTGDGSGATAVQESKTESGLSEADATTKPVPEITLAIVNPSVINPPVAAPPTNPTPVKKIPPPVSTAPQNNHGYQPKHSKGPGPWNNNYAPHFKNKNHDYNNKSYVAYNNPNTNNSAASEQSSTHSFSNESYRNSASVYENKKNIKEEKPPHFHHKIDNSSTSALSLDNNANIYSQSAASNNNSVNNNDVFSEKDSRKSQNAQNPTTTIMRRKQNPIVRESTLSSDYFSHPCLAQLESNIFKNYSAVPQDKLLGYYKDSVNTYSYPLEPPIPTVEKATSQLCKRLGFPTLALTNMENNSVYERLDLDTLFTIFYYKPHTYSQYLAARELKRQSWRFHKKYLTWFQRYEEPKIITDDYEQGTYIYFDYEGSWCQRKKSEFTFEYRFLEDVELV